MMKFFKENIWIITASIILGAWTQFIWINDWVIIFDSIAKYGAAFALIAALVAWFSVQRQIQAAKELNFLNNNLDLISSYKCIQTELLLNSVINEQLYTMIENNLEGDKLTNVKYATGILNDCINQSRTNSDKMFYNYAKIISMGDHEIYNDIAGTYLLIQKQDAHFQLMKTVIETAENVNNTSGLKKLFKDALYPISEAKNNFYSVSTALLIEIKKMEAEIK